MISELITLPDGSLCREELFSLRYDRPLLEDKKSKLNSALGHTLSDYRTPTEKDRDRLIYSAHLQRLSGVTQVVTPPHDGNALHSRFVHSMKVATLARDIASNFVRQAQDCEKTATLIASLGGLDIAACEAAGLAHDLGHPPFGHISEHIIDDWLRDSSSGSPRCPNGFEGNAQSFRTVARLDRLKPERKSVRGMELTAVTLAGILKYPWLRQFGNRKFESKFGAIHTEYGQFLQSREWFERDSGTRIRNRKYTQSLEAGIMDIADDITYALHDLQDFIIAQVIRIPAVTRDMKYARAALKRGGEGTEEREEEKYYPSGVKTFIDQQHRLATYYPNYFDPKLYRAALKWAQGKLEGLGSDTDGENSLEHTAHLKSQISSVIDDLVRSITIEPEPKWKYGPYVYMDTTAWHRVQVLKEVTKSYVIETPLIGMHQAAQSVTMFELLNKLEQWLARSGTRNHLPVRFRSYIDLSQQIDMEVSNLGMQRNFEDDPIKRAIADYCCSLTDLEAYRLSRFLQGHEIPRVIL
ncbi:dGTP triphosphohydrolase [Rhodococcus erythropolis]|uniref:dGTP triphosphohydrolase n=1 Tax=Rhodococcus erythropolis TaxID=1833 RepID=UPI0037A0348C